MKRILAPIGITIAMFAMSAASCDPIPPTVENIVVFVDEAPTVECGLGMTPKLGGCEPLPDVQGEPDPAPDCSLGGLGCDGQISTAEFPQPPLGEG